MGVLGLWNLIEDSGTQVNLETFRGKVLAIDLSIWINQSIKGFRDKDGRAVENAHTLGLFHRICKLLFYNIKPIFVFDGDCPTLKSRTLAKRHERKRKALAKSKNISWGVLEKYVHSQLGNDDNSSALLAAAKTKLRLSDNGLLSELFLPPKSQSRHVDIYQEFVELNQQISNRVNDSDSDEEAEKAMVTETSRKVELGGASYHIPQSQNIRDIDINSEDFKSLPPTTRYEILLEIKESYKGRKNPFPEMLPSDSDIFSQYQMNKLLKKRTLQEKIDKLIEELNGVNCENNIELMEKSGSMSSDTLAASYQQISGGRLASDEHTRFLFFKTISSKAKVSTSVTDVKEDVDVRNEQNVAVKDEQILSTQNLAYSLPNSVTESQFSSDLSRIEHLSQTSGNLKSNRLQSKQLAGHLDRNVQKLTKFEGKTQPPGDLNLSESESNSSTDSEDFVEVEPLEFETQEHFPDESNAFLESIELPYETDYCLNISQNEVATEESPLTTSITPSLEVHFEEEQEAAFISRKTANCREQLQPEVKPTTHIINLIDDEATKKPVIEEEIQQSVTPCESELVSVQPSVSHTGSVEETLNVEELAKRTQESNKISRQAASVTQQIVDDCKELLLLFGLPWVVAPAEAEAQCAQLEQLGLCEAVITDDSDIFLFGGSRVLRHFFTNSKTITQFLADDLRKYFGLDRSKLICLGMLCGTDYTLGIDGIGPVTGLELLSEFPGENLQPLVNFVRWYNDKLYSPETSGKPENAIRAKFLKFTLPNSFPSRVIFDAYYDANVDHSTEAFTWSSPQLSELRRFAQSKFGWSQPKADAILLPVLRNLNEKQVQSRIEFFFPSLSKNSSVTEKLNIKRSKRLNEAIRRNIRVSQLKESTTRKETTQSKKRRIAPAPSTSKQREEILVLSEESSSDSN